MTAVQMRFGLQALGHAVDGGRRRGKLAIHIPIAPQAFVVDVGR